MRLTILLIALGLSAFALPTFSAHAICMGDGEYEQALADVRAREEAQAQSEAADVAQEAKADPTETAQAPRPGSEPVSTN